MTTAAARALPARPPAQSLGEHILRTLALAVPVMVARSGLVIMITVGIVMAGHAGPHEQAYLGAAMPTHMTMLVIGIGLMMGVSVLSAQADGAGRSAECGRIWRLGMIVGGLLGLAFALLMLGGENLLTLFGMAPDLAAGGGRVLWMFAIGLPPIVMFVATSSFLESIGRAAPGMHVSLLANLVHLPLCWIFVFGGFGAPAMGAEGAALALSLTRWCMLAAILVMVGRLPQADRYGVRAPLGDYAPTVKKLFRVGLPLAVATGFEAIAFATTQTFAAWLGPEPLAVFQDALNLNALVFMLAIGLATATSVRVANAVGRDDQPGIRRAGWVGTGLVIVITGFVGILIAAGAEPIAALYTSNPAVRALLVPVLFTVAWVSVVDGLQCVLMGAARGTADTVVPTGLQAISFWGIMVPLTYGAYRLGFGVEGLFVAIGIAVIAASLFLGLRFLALTRRHIRPV
jgi:MATE family multidrug resistance protein